MKTHFLPLFMLAAFNATTALAADAPAASEQAEAAPSIPPIGFSNFVQAIKQGEWLANAPATEIGPNDLVIVDFWIPPTLGPSEFKAEKRGPAGNVKNFLPKDARNIKTIVMVPPVNNLKKERVLQSLANPRHATEFPVLWDGDLKLWQYILQGESLKSMPFAAVFKNGELMWSGESAHLPSWLLVEGVKENFTAKDAQERTQQDKENFKTLMANLSEVGKLINTKKPEDREKAMQLLEETEKMAGDHAGMLMFAKETRFSIDCFDKNLEQFIKDTTEMLDKYPDDEYVGNRIMKWCSGTAEWIDKPEIKRVQIKAAQNMINGKADDSDYQQACYMIQARIYEDLGEKDKAIEACTKGIQNSKEQKRLDALKRGETPVIY
ncbi:hypothetical protein [Akkermansia glycaniphila]|uniref:Tetratricopeptide-like helical domain n=1 Tax=Akkermansia glycaniphila TaxID=1679444 RepID=A0A1C7P9G4_9BACT|nr:hypothetical protein [Akkermansia glycaniphila]OCA02004.1 hypothetical protein AC781_12470 [Akkermansia glycaniphila]SEH93162.1 Hypothetical protein PYTT_1818 [Akkermansia glycaniphila]